MSARPNASVLAGIRMYEHTSRVAVPLQSAIFQHRSSFFGKTYG
jgi:hypothetical protein